MDFKNPLSKSVRITLTSDFREALNNNEDFEGWKQGTQLPPLPDMNGEGPFSLEYMFGECRLVKSLDLSGWDISKVNYIQGMFYDCNSATRCYMKSIA